jgi:hypothetical protein
MSDLNTVERSAPAAGGTAGVYQRLLDGVWWRWRFVLVPRLKRLGSWGNRACVKANFRRFPSWIPWWHSLKIESLYPVVVWAFAQKAPAAVDAD